jgi:hypothetical protein
MSFVKKSSQSKGNGWIWLGVLGGLLLSIMVAIIVKFVFSSGAFGNNNALILDKQTLGKLNEDLTQTLNELAAKG